MKQKKKKKRTYEEDLIASGVGLSLGSSVVGSIPASAASAGVQQGLATAGGFYPVLGTLGGARLTLKQLKKLRRKR